MKIKSKKLGNNISIGIKEDFCGCAQRPDSPPILSAREVGADTPLPSEGRGRGGVCSAGVTMPPGKRSHMHHGKGGSRSCGVTAALFVYVFLLSFRRVGGGSYFTITFLPFLM